MKPVRTLVLLASEAEARLLENAGVGKGLVELSGLKAEDFADVDQGFTEAPGRMNAAPGMGGHAFTPREGERDARRDAFARHIVDALERAWQNGKQDRIFIAAPPRLLGELRSRMGGAVAKVVAADLPKDLVKVPLKDLPGHLAELAVF